MHELLLPSSANPREAAAECEVFLSTRRRRIPLPQRCVPPETRLDLAPCLAWFEVGEELGEQPIARVEQSHGLDILARETEAAFGAAPHSALGIALAFSARRRALAPEPFRQRLDALRDQVLVRTYASRRTLEGHARALTAPLAYLALVFAGHSTEKRRILAEAVGTSGQLLEWVAGLSRYLRAGHLVLPADEIAARGVALADLIERRFRAETQALVADQCLAARGILLKGWDLALELGPGQGRLAAALLRRLHQRLRAIERRGFDVFSDEPRPPAWRLALASGLGLVWRRPPAELMREPGSPGTATR